MNKETYYKQALSKFKDIEPLGNSERKYYTAPNYNQLGEILNPFDIKILEDYGWENDNEFDSVTSYFIKRSKDYIEK